MIRWHKNCDFSSCRRPIALLEVCGLKHYNKTASYSHTSNYRVQDTVTLGSINAPIGYKLNVDLRCDRESPVTDSLTHSGVKTPVA